MHANRLPTALALGLGLATLALGCPVADPRQDLSGLLYESDCEDGDAPLWFFLFGHHYGGPGGFYPTTEMYLEMLQTLEDKGVADKAHFFFDGIAVDLLQREDPNHRLRSHLESAGSPLGYHGEEIHGPGPTILDDVEGLDWDAAEAAVAERYSTQITYTLDAATRMVDPAAGDELLPGTDGGLKLVRDYFGRDIDVMPNHGIPSPSTGLALRSINDFAFYQGANFFAWHWYRDQGLDSSYGVPAWDYFRRDVYLLWHMGRLTFKNPVETYWMDEGGPADTAERLKTLPLCRPTMTKILITEPVFAMGEGIDVAQDWIASHPGSTWLTQELLAQVVDPPTGTVDAGTLDVGARNLVLNWRGGPPDAMQVADEDWLSLADAFEAFAEALAAWNESGQLPSSVETTSVLGPRGEPDDVVLHDDPEAPASLRVADVAAAAGPVLEAVRANTMPFLPLTVTVAGDEVNAAEYLLALAQSWLMLRAGAPDATVLVGSRRPWPAIGEAEDHAFLALAATEERPLFYDKMQMWTSKPARIHW